MNQTNDDFLWLNGIEMYIDRYQSDLSPLFHDIKECIVRGDIHKLRNLVLHEIRRGYVEETHEFLNTIFSYHVPYKFLNNRNIMKYISHSINDEYLKRISATSINFHALFNFNDHFSRGQMMSKFWMIDELKKIANNFDEVAHYGGWYGTIYQLLNREFDIKKYRNYELDKVAAGIADTFNYKEVMDSWKFKTVIKDVGELKWHGDSVYHQVLNERGRHVSEEINTDLIINTSCEHMDETWFHNIPDGKLICLQTNNYFDNEQHINCVEDEDAALKKYPMSEVYYKGTIDTYLYKRFMLIGKK